jgi:hypothetical protein
MSNLSKEEKFRIILNASDGNFPGIEYSREEFVRPDIDNDNDGMVDELELKYFHSLDARPEDDPDYDGIPNGIEIGVDTPEHTDPTDDGAVIGDPTNNGTDKKEVLPPWIIYTGLTIIVIITLVVIGFMVILRISREKERREDEDIDRRVREMERRQKEISGLYGKNKAEEYFGPDQTTLDDLILDMGGEVYHEEGSRSLGDVRKGTLMKPDGPLRTSSGGPVFEEGAPGLSLGESLDISDEIPKEIDDSKLDRSMEELMK